MQNYDWRPTTRFRRHLPSPRNDISGLGPLKLFMGVFRVSILTLRLIFVCAQITTFKNAKSHTAQKLTFRFSMSVGPCHPSAHGVFRLIAQLLAESIIWHDPKIVFCIDLLKFSLRKRSLVPFPDIWREQITSHFSIKKPQLHQFLIDDRIQ